MTAARHDGEYAALRESVIRALDAKFAQARSRGLAAADLDRDGALAGRISAAVPTGHPVADVVGACYDTAGLTQWLQISKQALQKRNAARTILACRSADGHWVYPAWQFSNDRRVIPALAELVAILCGADDDRWRAALWLAAPSPDLPGRVSAAQWLGAGGDPGPVLAAAHADAARWAA